MPTKIKQANSKPQKAGYTWVADPRAKGGGYWRKLKAGMKAGGLASKLIAGAVVAGGAAAAAQAMRKRAQVATAPRSSPDLRGMSQAEANAAHLEKIKRRNTAITVGVIGATNAALIASDIAEARAKQKQAQEASSGYSSSGTSGSGSKRSSSGTKAEPTQSWHETLGVDPNASPADVKKAYREAAKKYHPDVNKSPEAEQRMKDLNNAYEKAKKRRRDSLHWENINAAYRKAWKAYPSVNVRFWVTNL